MVNPQEGDARQQDLNHATAEVVGDKQIWVDQVELIDEHLQHLLLCLEDLDVGIALLLNLLLQVEGKRLLVELAQEGEALELVLCRGAVLVYLALDDARDEGNLLGVVLRPSQLRGAGEGDEGWAGLVDIVEGADGILRVSDGHLLLAPGAAVVAGLGGVLEREPARSLDLLLKDEEL